MDLRQILKWTELMFLWMNGTDCIWTYWKFLHWFVFGDKLTEWQMDMEVYWWTISKEFLGMMESVLGILREVSWKFHPKMYNKSSLPIKSQKSHSKSLNFHLPKSPSIPPKYLNPVTKWHLHQSTSSVSTQFAVDLEKFSVTQSIQFQSRRLNAIPKATLCHLMPFYGRAAGVNWHVTFAIYFYSPFYYFFFLCAIFA